jgi:hypothetical protein
MWNLARKCIATLLIASLSQFAIVGAAQATLIGTDTAAATATAEEVSGKRTRVLAFLDREDVAREFDRLGVSPAEAKARVAAMSDADLLSLSDRIDRAPAGGDAIGAIITAAVLVFIVLLITDILGLTKVFSFTRPIKR